MNSQPTLLVFTLGAEREHRRRRLLPGLIRGGEARRAELALHDACFDAAVDAGRAAGCRIEVSSPASPSLEVDRWRRQAGRGFGRRLISALAASEAENDGPVVLVGTDVPGLGPRHVRAALDAVGGDAVGGDTRKVVLGPSPDGGFYLLAAARPVARLLDGVPFCRRDTLKCLRRVLLRAGFDVVLLEPLADLDRRRDVEHLIATAILSDPAWRRLLGRLRRLLAELRRPLEDALAPPPRPVPVAVPSVRGPPRSRS